MMRHQLVLCLLLFVNSSTAQCPCPIKQLLLYPSSKSISLKWICSSKANNGQFIVYRTCLSPIKEREKEVHFSNYSERYDYVDGNLKYGYHYEYRLKFVSPNCSCNAKAIAIVNARANEDDSVTTKIMNVKDYTQSDLCVLTPQKTTIQANSYVETQITFKNPKALTRTDFKYCVIYGDKMIETTAEFNNPMNFQLASIFIPDHFERINECRIAITSGKNIIGISSTIIISR